MDAILNVDGHMPWLLQWEKGGEVAGDAGTERWMLYLR